MTPRWLPENHTSEKLKRLPLRRCWTGVKKQTTTDGEDHFWPTRRWSTRSCRTWSHTNTVPRPIESSGGHHSQDRQTRGGYGSSYIGSKQSLEETVSSAPTAFPGSSRSWTGHSSNGACESALWHRNKTGQQKVSAEIQHILQQSSQGMHGYTQE